MLDYMRGYLRGYKLLPSSYKTFSGKSDTWLDGYHDGTHDRLTGYLPLYPKWHYLWLPVLNILIGAFTVWLLIKLH